jgi:hypothetical protein
VPVENSFRYAREYKAMLHVIDSDHRMLDNIRDINYFFEYFLIQMDKYV